MYSPLEGQIVRSLAVIALAAAVLTAGIITINSGMFGGGAGKSAGASDTVGAGAGTTTAGSEAASETPSTTTTTPGSSRSHVVEAGDSFYTISRKYDTSIAAIQQLNPNLDPSNLTPGTRVSIP